MVYDFDQVVDRRNTQSQKWDNMIRMGNGDAIPMWIADMDFPCPQPVIEAVMTRAKHPIYAYPKVDDSFYSVTAHWIKRRYGWEIDPSWAVFTVGITPIYNNLIIALTEPGDKIIIQPPVYQCFPEAVLNNGREISANMLRYRDGKYTMDFEDLQKRAADPKAKIMILSSPHNPVGRVWTRDELLQVAKICYENNVLLISDEIHGDFMLFGHEHIPTASLNETYAKNIVTCYAPTKTFNIAGIRCAAIIIPDEKLRALLNKQLRAVRANELSIFAQPAYIAAYTLCDDYIEQLRKYLEESVEYVDSFFKKHMPKIKLVRPESTYLLWFDCSELGMTSKELEEFFIQKAAVGVMISDYFGVKGIPFMRMNIACSRVTLKQALEQLLEAYNKL